MPEMQGIGGICVCDEGLGSKGIKKLEGKGLSLSAGVPLGTEGECGATARDASQTLWQHWGAPWPRAPAFGERGRWGCRGLLSFGGADPQIDWFF